MTERLVVIQKETGGQGVVKADLDPFQTNTVIPAVPCDISVYVGALVIMRPTGVAENALADSLANSNVIGIVDSKVNDTACNIRVANVTLDIFSGLDVTREYYLSATVAGGMSTAIPTESGQVRLKIGQPFSETAMLLMKGDRMVRS